MIVARVLTVPPPQGAERDEEGGEGRSGHVAWKFATAFAAFPMLSTGSQECSDSSYPIQSTRLKSWPRTILESRIVATSCCGAPSTKTGGGGATTRPGKVLVWYGSRRLTWKTGWIFKEDGRSKRYEEVPIRPITGKGPRRRTSSFEEGRVDPTWRRDSHTI